MGINSLKDRIRGKKVAILGLGISNFPLIEFMHNCGAREILALDKAVKDELKSKIAALSLRIPFEYHLGDDYLSYLTDDVDEIYKTPGLRYDIPDLVKARERGAIITSEMEEFMKICPAKMYAVTGSDGKTTTTTLIYKLLQEEYRDTDTRVWVGGNIGNPLLEDIEEIKENDKVVLELSSFQLMNLPVSANVSVITNLSPNHLDVHKSYLEYIDAKKNIFLHQDNNDIAILNKDNGDTFKLAKEVKGKLRLFGWGIEDPDGVYCEQGRIYSKRDGNVQELMSVGDIKIPGRHNVENYMAAICAVMDEVKVSTIINVARTFNGVEHRIEFIREINGVKYFNSSIDSSPNRTMHALDVFNSSIVLIAGGKDKGIPFDDLGPALYGKVRVLILIGCTADKIETAARQEFERRNEEYSIRTIRCKTYEEVVQVASREAKPGEVVLLSPASTSFDMFNNFEERGNTFKKLVNNISI